MRISVHYIKDRQPGLIWPLLLVFIVSFASCGDSGWGGKRYVKNGLEITENPEKGIWPADKIRLTQDLVLGDDDDPHQLFFKIQGVGVSSDGRIHVLDSGNRRIAVFDEHGVFLFEYGRAGAGPGEFGEPNGMSLDTAGNVYVLDRQLRRVTKFNSQGEYLLAYPIQTYLGYIEALSEDMVLLSGMLFGRFGAFGGLYDLAGQAYRFHLELPFPTEVEFPGRVSVSLEERYQVLSDGYINLLIIV
ncbi:MAG: 6-bladed beta-propeller [Acidobacteriota bacterium]|nr:6-bladed beta-propeller [Acidobacteriota bacterium]